MNKEKVIIKKIRIEIELDEIIRIIKEKEYNFIIKYNQRPKYVVIPLYLSVFLKIYNGVYFDHNGNKSLLGLNVVETITKNNIKEIEVL